MFPINIHRYDLLNDTWCYGALTFVDLEQSHSYNEAQGQQFPYSEDVLDTCGQTHTEAVHPCQKYCKHSYTPPTLNIRSPTDN